MGIAYTVNRDGLFCPAVICDVCDERIADLSKGNVEWVWSAGDETAEAIYFTHKQCSFQLRRMGIDTYSEELRLFPIHLASNSGMGEEAKAMYHAHEAVRKARIAPSQPKPRGSSGARPKRNGKMVKLPNRQPGDLAKRFRVFKRDGYRCQLCGRAASDDLELELDHKVPKARGGSDNESNLWVLCWDCNRGKRDNLL